MATFVGGNDPDTYVGTDGPDTIEGGRGQDTLSGAGGNDSITASTDADVLSGGAGDDFFRLDVCAVVIGGEGRDTFKFGGDGIYVGNGAVYDLGAQTIITDFDIRIGGDVIDLNGQFTTIGRPFSGFQQQGRNPFATGEARLLDTAEGVQIQLQSAGEWKSMALLVGVRSDQLNSSHFVANRTITVSLNDDSTQTTLIPIDPHNTPVGLTIDGTAGGEVINASLQNDSVRGFDGGDTIYGQGGDDDINGNQGNDTLDGGPGADWVRGGQGDDTITGADGGDPHVNGNLGDDRAHGGLGSDTVYGGQGDDSLYGEDGNDQLSGDLGHDLLFGGAGADRFMFGPGQGRDWIMDWNPAEGDRIALPTGAAYTITSYQDQVMIEMAGGAGLGIQQVPESAFSRDYIIFV